MSLLSSSLVVDLFADALCRFSSFWLLSFGEFCSFSFPRLFVLLFLIRFLLFFSYCAGNLIRFVLVGPHFLRSSAKVSSSLRLRFFAGGVSFIRLDYRSAHASSFHRSAFASSSSLFLLWKRELRPLRQSVSSHLDIFLILNHLPILTLIFFLLPALL